MSVVARRVCKLENAKLLSILTYGDQKRGVGIGIVDGSSAGSMPDMTASCGPC
jgi:hypothetical protein